MPKPVGIYSASGISAILGLNPYKTVLHAWQEVMEKLQPGFNGSRGYVLPEFPDNAPIRWGNVFENSIIKLAEEKGGREIVDREKLFKKKIGDIELSCHIDGRIVGEGIHEGKTCNIRAFHSIKDLKRRWGDPGTEQTPEEYQVQASVQRICTGEDLVKLSVLVFPKPVNEWDGQEGGDWEIVNDDNGYFIQPYYQGASSGTTTIIHPIEWARPLAEMGYFHTYNLPKNEPLESAIIKSLQEFDENHVQTSMPPEFGNYDDVRRILTRPQGTVIATPELKAMAAEYSEITRQLGNSGPMTMRKESLKVEIMNAVYTMKKDDWSTPPDKIELVDPEGGGKLVSFSESGFRAKRAT